MMLEFGKFIPGRMIPKMVLAGYLLLVYLSAGQTALALGIPDFWPVYALFALLTDMVCSRRILKEPRFTTVVGLLCSFFMYYPFLTGLWKLSCICFGLSREAEAAGTLGVLCFCILLVAYGYRHTKEIEIVSYPLELGMGEYRIACISDLHLGDYVGLRHTRKLVEHLNGLQPDLVVLVGDVFEIGNTLLEGKEEALDQISRMLGHIQSREGVYAVTGNHDPAVSNPSFRAFLRQSGIVLLDNEGVELPGCNLIGRTDQATGNRAALSGLMEEGNPAKPTIVLDHRPEGMEEGAAAGADLVLCGHTHRGQFFPSTLLTKWVNGKDHFYGYHRKGKTHCIVTSGVGFFAPPVRIGTSNEVVAIQITG